jgi:transposase-like protein
MPIPSFVWVICPRCLQRSGVLLPGHSAGPNRFECDDCGHEWTEADKKH